MNVNYIRNEVSDIVESLEPLEALEMALAIIEQVTNGLEFELVTNEDKKTFNTLSTIETQLNELITDNKGAN